MLIFPLAFPENEESAHHENARLVAEDLQREGVEVLDANRLVELKRHVLTAESEDLALSGEGRRRA